MSFARSAGLPRPMSLTRLMSWPRRGLVETWLAYSFGSTLLSLGFALDGVHGVIDGLADGRLGRARLEVGPAGFLGTQKMLSARYSSGSSGSAPSPRRPRRQLGVLGLERVADVLEEDEPQDDVLVLGGVHVVAEGVGGLPELGLEAVGGARFGRGGAGLSLA